MGYIFIGGKHESINDGSSITRTNIQTLKDLQEPVYLQAYKDSRVVAIAMLSYARLGGSREHQELKIVHQNIGKKIIGN